MEIYYRKWPAPWPPWGRSVTRYVRIGGERTATPLRRRDSEPNRIEPRGSAGHCPPSGALRPCLSACQHQHRNVPATRQHSTPAPAGTGTAPHSVRSAPHTTCQPTGSQLAVLDQVSTARLQAWSSPGSLSRCVPAGCRKWRAEGGQAVHGILSGRRPVVHAEGSATHHPIRQPASHIYPARFNAHARARAVCWNYFRFENDYLLTCTLHGAFIVCQPLTYPFLTRASDFVR